jgi:hypothetical protein
MIKLPKKYYFEAGNHYTGSFTQGKFVFNYYVKYEEDFICKIWKGLLNSETAEDVIEKHFENLEDVSKYLENSVK